MTDDAGHSDDRQVHKGEYARVAAPASNRRPDLLARVHDLYRERGLAQQERKAYDAAMKALRSERAKRRRAVYHRLNVRVDATFDEFLTTLGCKDGRNAELISHWQDDPAGFRIQVTRLSDGKALTRFVASGGLSDGED